MIRGYIGADFFYENDPRKLSKQIEDCFYSQKGPGELPGLRNSKIVRGLIVPHASYNYSGICSAWGYKEIGESKFPDIFVIIGSNHKGQGSDFSTCLSKDWVTPFGKVSVARSFGRRLIEEFPKLKDDITAFESDYSIEVQLPFLQYATRDRIGELKILPILINNFSYEDCLKLADSLSNYDNICVISAVDFVHYGPLYNYVPFIHSKKSNINELDTKCIEYILKMDSKGFYNHQSNLPICGTAPTLVCMEFSKYFGIKKSKLLNYYVSGDVSGDYNNSVSYATLLFR